jgi:hypothetical protein
MLKHEVIAADEWLDNGPQDLFMVSLCIQIAIDKMQLFSLSIAYACSYHNLSATMGHSVHNADISKTLTHTMPYMRSAVVSPFGRTAKFFKTMEAAYGRENEHSIIWQHLWWTFLQSACQLHAPST